MYSKGKTVVIEGSSTTTGMPMVAMPTAAPTYQASSSGQPTPEVRTSPNSFHRFRISPVGSVATGLWYS